MHEAHCCGRLLISRLLGFLSLRDGQTIEPSTACLGVILECFNIVGIRFQPQITVISSNSSPKSDVSSSQIIVLGVIESLES